MFNALLGGAFGIQNAYWGQQQAMYQQQLQNYSHQFYPVCHHQRTECLKCKEEKAERERISAEKKVAYTNRCKEWMSKVGRKQPMTHEEKARNIGTALLNDYDNQLISRGIFIKRFSEALASAEKKGREEALKAFNPYPNNPTHKGCECDVCMGRQWNEDKRHG